MGLGSLILYNMKLPSRIGVEINPSSQHKQISQSQYDSNKPKPHSLTHTERTETCIELFYLGVYAENNEK